MQRTAPALIALLACLTAPGRALAHASEQGLVLLLPTDLYIAGGVAAVALTVLLLAVLPARAIMRAFRPIPLTRASLRRLQPATSGLALGLLALLVLAGLRGPQDPLGNPLPLFIWTVFWIGLVTVQALLGNVWAWVNPWTGALLLIRRLTGARAVLRLPASLAQGIGLLTFVAFAYLLLADPAPADPTRLARLVALYWTTTLILALIFGPRWLRRAEGFGLVLGLYARLAMLGRRHGRLCLGLPGWQITRMPPPSLIAAILCVVLLGTGSFDGLNESFAWLSLNGINPFEYPGRSAMIGRTMLGLLGLNLALLGILALCIRAGLWLVRAKLSPSQGFRLFAPAILPIALGYHIAHFLPSFLVDGQYVLLALSDPLHSGADLLGLGAHYVSTGFFNTRDTVRVIFLAQAGAVVLGHILAVLLAHGIALCALGNPQRAALSQVPLAGFMIAYTLFGLWLLAAPRI